MPGSQSEKSGISFTTKRVHFIYDDWDYGASRSSLIVEWCDGNNYSEKLMICFNNQINFYAGFFPDFSLPQKRCCAIALIKSFGDLSMIKPESMGKFLFFFSPSLFFTPA